MVITHVILLSFRDILQSR